ncbi:MAG: sugar phosphate isomerase/epimerase family protein [bacterium]
MTRIAMGTWTFIFPPYEDKPEDFDSVLDHAAELGFEGVEVGWFSPHPDIEALSTPEARAAYRKKFDDRGLGLAGVVANFDGCPSFLSNEDNGGFLDALDTQLGICTDTGIDMLRLDIPDAPEVINTVGYEVAHERLVNTWSEAARRGGERGVRIGWEFEPGTPFNKPSEIFRVVEEVTDPSFGIIYDTVQAHNVANGSNQIGEVEVLEGGQVEFLERLKGRITHIHLIDADGSLFDDRFSRHIPFGKGDVDWETVMPALVAAGSGDDWWTIDVCWWDDAWPVFEDGLEFVRELRDRYAG